MPTDSEVSPGSVHERSLLRVEEAAEQLRVTRQFVYRLIQDGELPAVHVGRFLRVRPQDLRAYIDRGGSGRSPA